MAFELWTHQFCLACDKQTDGATYCSQSCRLADFEKSSTPSSNASSPGYAPQGFPYTLPTQRTPTAQPQYHALSPSSSSTPFYFSPAYDFAAAQPYGRTPQRQSYLAGSSMARIESSSSTTTTRQQQPARVLTPSSSHSSLCSMQSASSTNSAAEMYHLSEKSRRELHVYHMNLEQARLHRRRSY